MTYTYCIDYEAFGLDDSGNFQKVTLHILCANEAEAEIVANVLNRDKVQYENVVVTEIDEPIEEINYENH